MTLTEEQRAALKRVAAYMDRMYGIASPYYGCTEDANILRAMIDSSDHIRESPKMVGFDLEENRAAIDSAINSLLCEGWDNEASTVRRLVAEIERLRGYEIAARDLSADLTKVAGARDEQAARIEELEADLAQSEICIRARLDVIDQQAARIKELEDARKRSGAKYAKIINELRSSVYANIPGLDVGKIGPDAKPRVWQITEERIGLLRYCLDSLLDAPDIEESPGPRHSIEMLRAMLTEAA